MMRNGSSSQVDGDDDDEEDGTNCDPGDNDGEANMPDDQDDAYNASGNEEEKVKAKRVRIPAKFRNKKPSDMPRRPLSAYNLFFRDQRTLIMAERNQGLSQARASGGLFESMAKTIAARWKEISKTDLEKYSKLANQDTLRYREQMAQYNKKFVEDKSIAAKRRRAENRKRKQLEKAHLKGLETKGNVNSVSASFSRPMDHASLSSQLTHGGVAANYPAPAVRMSPSDSTSYHPADLQMRLLAAHAEGLGLAIPPTPSGQMTDYLRQLNSTQGSRTFQQSTPSESAGQQESSINYDAPATPQDPLSILQMLQQQQNFRLPTSTTADFENFFALQQLQRSGQQLQMQPQLPQMDPSYGLLFQLQQQQQQQQDMARFSAEANFYQQQRPEVTDGNEADQPDWQQQYPNNHQPH